MQMGLCWEELGAKNQFRLGAPLCQIKTLQLSQGWRFTTAAISLSWLIHKIFDQNQIDVASVPCFLEGVVAELTQLVQDVELYKAFTFFSLFIYKNLLEGFLCAPGWDSGSSQSPQKLFSPANISSTACWNLRGGVGNDTKIVPWCGLPWT